MTTDLTSFRFSEDAKEVDFDSYNRVWTSLGFPISLSVESGGDFMEGLFGLGVRGFFVFDPSGRLVALAEVFSDEKTCAWLAAFCVHHDFQNSGIGTRLIERIFRTFSSVPMYIHAYPPRDGFYSSRGARLHRRLAGFSRPPLSEMEKDITLSSPLAAQGLKILSDAGAVDFNDVKAVYNAAGSPRVPLKLDPDFWSRFFSPGVFSFFAYCNEGLAGVARVFSNDTSYSWLAEMCVADTCLALSVRHALLAAINSRFAHTDLYVAAEPKDAELFESNLVKRRPKIIICLGAGLEPTTDSAGRARR